jgi:hypothetical protein
LKVRFFIILGDWETIQCFGLLKSKDIELDNNGKVYTVNRKSSKILVFTKYDKKDKFYPFDIHQLNAHVWNRRIEELRNVGDYQDALKLSYEFYKGVGHGVIGIPSNQKERENKVSVYISDLIFQYFRLAPSKLKNAKIFEEVANECIEYTLQLFIRNNNPDIFSRLYDEFEKKLEDDTFISIIEQYILTDRLTSFITNKFLSNMIDYYESKKRIDDLENIILHLDLSKDLSNDNYEKLMKLCNTYREDSKLLKLYIYLFNSTRDDFISPINELAKVLFYFKTKKQKYDTGLHHFNKRKNYFGIYSTRVFDWFIFFFIDNFPSKKKGKQNRLFEFHI